MSRWAQRVRAVSRLGTREWVFLARVAVTAGAVDLLLRSAPLPRVARACARRGSGWGVPETDRVVGLTDRLLAVDVGPLRPNCVVRSMILLRYLPERGLVLKMGIRPGVRPVDGHAWVEGPEGPVAEKVDPRERYVETWSWTR